MGERIINPLFNVHEKYKETMILNPYRFGGGGGDVQYDYITNDGSSYFNTGYFPTLNTGIKGTAKFNSAVIEDTMYMGSLNTSGDGFLACGYRLGKTTALIADRRESGFDGYDLNFHTWTSNPFYRRVDSLSISTTERRVNLAVTGNIALLYGGYSATRKKGNITMTDAQITEWNGSTHEVVRDYRPFLIGGVAKMKCILTDDVLEPIGGSFTVGNF